MSCFSWCSRTRQLLTYKPTRSRENNSSFYTKIHRVFMSVMSKEGLISLIEPNLYLGLCYAAKDVPTLEKYKITHILTIDLFPLEEKIQKLKNVTAKFIQMRDEPQQDLLRYFDESHEFITEGQCKGTVLVHCHLGVSRSATVVIAHIMKKHRLSFQEAYDFVKNKRRWICPNSGFLSQLNLYSEMGYKLDPDNIKYKYIQKIFRLYLASLKIRELGSLPESFQDVVKPDPESGSAADFVCSKCREVLAAESNQIVHEYSGEVCAKNYFFEPLCWMDVEKHNHKFSHHIPSRKLFCPGCGTEVGFFDWLGITCACDVEVVPAFYLMPSKVDFVKAKM